MALKKLILILTFGLVAACSNQTKPDLVRLYKTTNKSTEVPAPVILIHGIMGSKLRS